MIYKFRKMIPADFEEYASWYKNSGDTKISRFLGGPTPDWLACMTQDPDANAYAVLDDEKMVAHIQCDSWPPSDITLSIVVHPEKWGQGIASKAMKQFIDKILQNKKRILVHVEPENIPSTKLFKKLGFKKAKEQNADPPLVTYELYINNEAPVQTNASTDADR